MNIAQKLQILMKNKGVSSSRLARELGVHTSTVSNWLSGKDVRAENLTALCKYFDCSMDYLVGKTEEKTAPESSDLDTKLDGIDFALYGEVKDLTDAQKRDVLRFVKFLKQDGQGDE